MNRSPDKALINKILRTNTTAEKSVSLTCGPFEVQVDAFGEFVDVTMRTTDGAYGKVRIPREDRDAIAAVFREAANDLDRL
jgi:hypothetical protein